MARQGRRETRRQREARLEREAENRRERAAEARAERNAGIRAGNIERMAPELIAWQDSLGDYPNSGEVPIMPLGVDAKITDDYDAPRRKGIHSSLDFAPAEPTTDPVPVLSAVSGRVLFVGDWDGDSGYTMFVGGNDGLIYSYCHLRRGSEMLRPGDRVRQGQPIAIMGSSGEGDGPHLHYVARIPPQEFLQYARVGETPNDAMDRMVESVRQRTFDLRDFNNYARVRFVLADGSEPRSGDRIPVGAPLIPMGSGAMGPVPLIAPDIRQQALDAARPIYAPEAGNPAPPAAQPTQSGSVFQLYGPRGDAGSLPPF